MVILRNGDCRGALPDRLGNARGGAAAPRCGMDRFRRRDRYHHLGRAGDAAHPFALLGDRRRRSGPAGACSRTPVAAGGEPMNRLRLLIKRVPNTALFAAAGLLQVVLIATIVIDRAGILREGTEITLQTRPVDPRDFLRGDYVQLRYQISTVKLGALAGTPIAAKHVPVFVKLAPDVDGFYGAVSVHLLP